MKIPKLLIVHNVFVREKKTFLIEWGVINNGNTFFLISSCRCHDKHLITNRLSVQMV